MSTCETCGGTGEIMHVALGGTVVDRPADPALGGTAWPCPSCR